MANTKDLLGALLRRGMTDSSAQRIEHSLGESGIGSLGGILEKELGISLPRETAAAGARQTGATREDAARRQESRPASPPQQRTQQAGAAAAESQNPLDALGGVGDLLKSFLGDGSGSGSPMAAGGLGALVGSILGGGGKSAKGALGGGALALLGSIAMQALRNAQQGAQAAPADSATKLAAGLREPENAHEEQEVQQIVDVTVKAMINAAKADGQIDEDEMQKIVGELQEDGVTQAERDYLIAEVRKPQNTAELVRGATNPQVAAQVYAASLLAIEVDTPAEKNYLKQLARDLKLDDQVVKQIHTILNVAA